MQNLVHHRRSLKVIVAAAQMHKSPRGEHAFFIEDDANSPGPALDGVPAVTALGHTSRRSLSSIDSRNAMMRQATLCHLFEMFSRGHPLTRLSKNLQEWLRALIRRT